MPYLHQVISRLVISTVSNLKGNSSHELIELR